MEGTDFRGQLIDDPSVWSIKIWSKGDVQSGKILEEQEESEFVKWLDSLEAEGEPSEYAEETARRLSWSYPYIKASNVPAKVSVTELKRRYNEMVSEDAMAFPEYLPALVKKPMFLEEKNGLSYAEKGQYSTLSCSTWITIGRILKPD